VEKYGFIRTVQQLSYETSGLGKKVYGGSEAGVEEW
jgi:hypothetical protein